MVDGIYRRLPNGLVKDDIELTARAVHLNVLRILENHADELFPCARSDDLDEHVRESALQKGMASDSLLPNVINSVHSIHICQLRPDEVHPHRQSRRTPNVGICCRDFALIVAPIIRRLGIEMRLLRGCTRAQIGTQCGHVWIVLVHRAGGRVAMIDNNRAEEYGPWREMYFCGKHGAGAGSTSYSATHPTQGRGALSRYTATSAEKSSASAASVGRSTTSPQRSCRLETSDNGSQPDVIVELSPTGPTMASKRYQPQL